VSVWAVCVSDVSRLMVVIEPDRPSALDWCLHNFGLDESGARAVSHVGHHALTLRHKLVLVGHLLDELVDNLGRHNLSVWIDYDGDRLSLRPRDDLLAEHRWKHWWHESLVVHGGLRRVARVRHAVHWRVLHVRAEARW